jgi:hypothetical protein
MRSVMSDPLRPGPEESFAELLREGAKKLREERGPCPGAEELVSFFHGQLESDDASRVRTHVEACGLCDVALGRLQLASETPAIFARKAVISFFRNPIIAYAFVLILLLPAYRGIISFRNAGHLSDLDPSPISAPRYFLDSVRGGQPALTVKLPPGREVFILSFLVPVRPKFQYSAEIVNAAGAPINPASELIPEDELGHCSLICARRTFRTGIFRLTVKERTPQGVLTDRQFAFQFAVEE